MFPKIPIHVALFAAFPALTLLAANIGEVEPAVVLRPLLVSLLIALGLYATLAIFLRQATRRGAVATALLLLIFSYGHVYHLLETEPILGIGLGHHRYLGPAYAALAGLSIWGGSRRGRDLGGLTALLNLVGVVLVLMPVGQVAAFQLAQRRGNEAARSWTAAAQPLMIEQGTDPPDVYYIILDTYARSDLLARELGFDNRPFLDALQELGFYTAPCSRSNYASTDTSLASSLNLAYVSDLESILIARGADLGDIRVLIKHSVARELLEQAGYETVAFFTTYEWTDLSDADIYYGFGEAPALQTLNPFESLFVKSTAALLVTDWLSTRELSRLASLDYPHGGHIASQRSILEQLPRVALNPEPTFTLAHVLIPHVPYVFAPDGEIRTDPGFYGGDRGGPLSDQYFVEGYTGEVEFINREMLVILRSILAASPVPPIIVIQGDHGFLGWRDPSAQASILNAYYLPGAGRERLYPEITPVNTFRLIFDTYFGTHHGLLDDRVYAEGIADPIAETSAACQPPN